MILPVSIYPESNDRVKTVYQDRQDDRIQAVNVSFFNTLGDDTMQGIDSKTVDGVLVNRAHYNLNKGCFSLQEWRAPIQTGKPFRWIVGRNPEMILMEDVIPWYSPAGLQNIKDSGVRQVAAGIQGRVRAVDETSTAQYLLSDGMFEEIFFNPHRDEFFRYQDGEEWTGGKTVLLYRPASYLRGKMFTADWQVTFPE